MEGLTNALVACVMGFILTWILLDGWKGFRMKRPPGPIRLPLLGNLLFMLPSVMDPMGSESRLGFLRKFFRFRPAFIILHKLSRTYGPIMSIKFGMNHGVIISTSKYAREVFCRDEFTHRFSDGWFTERSFGKPLGLIFNNGSMYKQIKNFTVKNLKDFGFGRKTNMENAVNEELHDFLDHLRRKVGNNGQIVKMERMFTLAVLNILWMMVSGMRFSYGDEKLLRLLDDVEELSRSFDIGGNILMAYPFLRHVAPEATGHGHQMRLYEKLHEFFRAILRERQHGGSLMGNPQDFVDVFRDKIESTRSVDGPGDNNDQVFTEEQFIIVMLDLFTAGSETTANTLDFGILYMILYPEVQRKVQAEIDEVIGKCRLPCMADMPKMPYTEATLLEVQRISNVIPLVHRVCTKATQIGGYRIEKDDVMVVNLHSVHMDEKVWDNPKLFRPERFLDDSGCLINSPNFLPFGMGKRVCIGEVLAKMALFKYFVATLQKFTFSIPKDHTKPLAHPGRGFTVCPNPFSVYMNHRV